MSACQPVGVSTYRRVEVLFCRSKTLLLIYLGVSTCRRVDLSACRPIRQSIHFFFILSNIDESFFQLKVMQQGLCNSSHILVGLNTHLLDSSLTLIDLITHLSKELFDSSLILVGLITHLLDSSLTLIDLITHLFITRII